MPLKELTIRGACNVGAALRAVCGPLRAGAASILMYHRVAEPVPGLPAPTLNVPPARLELQLRGLRRRGYQFWPLRQLLEAQRRGDELPANTLAVTFDDGYENMHSRMFPVIRELRIPVTVFVCTATLDSQQPLFFDDWGLTHQSRLPSDAYRPLRLEQCRELLASGLVELGAHTHTHRDFRGRTQEFREDLQRCVAMLRDQLQIDQPSFAFPFGRMDEGFATGEMVAAARDCGVSCALTTEPGPLQPGQSPFHWGRNNVFPWDSAATIDARLTGWYQWLPATRRWLRQRLRIAAHPLDNQERRHSPVSSSPKEAGR